MAVYNDEDSFYVPNDLIKDVINKIDNIDKYTYDMKKVYVSFKKENIEITNITFDTMLATYLLDYNVKDDIAYIANNFDNDIQFYEKVYGKNGKFTLPNEDVIAYNTLMKARFIYETHDKFYNDLIKEEQLTLLEEIEMPLTYVLGDMEYNGVNVDVNKLTQMGEEICIKLELISKDIYNHAGIDFNISSPSQLGDILFDKLGLPHGKKT